MATQSHQDAQATAPIDISPPRFPVPDVDAPGPAVTSEQIDAFLAAEPRSAAPIRSQGEAGDATWIPAPIPSQEMGRLGVLAHDTFVAFGNRIQQARERHQQVTSQAETTLRQALQAAESALGTAQADAERTRQQAIRVADSTREGGRQHAATMESQLQSAVRQTNDRLEGLGSLRASGNGDRHASTTSVPEAHVRSSISTLDASLAGLGATITRLGEARKRPYFKYGAIAGSVGCALVFAMFGGWSGFFSGLLFFGPIVGLLGGLFWRQAEQGRLRWDIGAGVTSAQALIDEALANLRGYRYMLDEVSATRHREAQQVFDTVTARATQRHREACSAARMEHAQVVAEADATLRTQTSDTERWYRATGDRLRDQVATYRDAVEAMAPPWPDPSWREWAPADTPLPTVYLGDMHVFAGLDGETFVRDAIPVVQDVPYGLSMVWRHQGAEHAHVPEAALMRILTAIPAGKLRFVLLDPVGLGRNVASLMHLHEHDPDLIADRAWVEPRHIEQQLADLSEQMQTIIQKYLKREFETMEAYNQQAGNIEEPYRVLVVNNFPANFTTDALRHLVNIATIGPRCGVYTLIAIDDAQKLPHGFVLDDLLNAASMVLAGVPVTVDGTTEMAFSIREPKLHSLMVTPDPGPPAELARNLLDRIGKAAVSNSVVKVPFSDLVPADSSQWWSEKSVDRLRAPIGIFGARKPQMLTLGAKEKGGEPGDGVLEDLFNGVLMVGRPGSGKSNLNHVAILSLATAYSPEELELYLLDFKQGVEFSVYVKSQLPHARVIAVESEREFALSVLKRLDQELEDRGKRFREATAEVDDTASIATYRHRTGKTLPRIVLLIDEYQELFTEDDALAQTASVVLERLVRLGRAYGIHLILSTQTLAGNANLNKRATQGLMTVRIALMSSDADARLILAEDNPEARLLNRPGEAIYNDQSGRLEGNNRFQAAYLSSDERSAYLTALAERAAAEYPRLPPPIVFEGNRAADVGKNRELADLIAGTAAPGAGPKAWVGDPVAIAGPIGPGIRREGGSNLLIVGQELDLAYGMLGTAAVGIARYHELRRDGARLDVVDMGPVDTSQAEVLARIVGAFPGIATQVSRRRLVDCIESLYQELDRRLALEDEHALPPRYLLIAGLQRARDLRGEDMFSFGSALDDAPQVSPRQMFAKLLREGPDVGMHVLAWVDTASNLFRTIEQRVLSEFDHRIVMQMSADDSFKLIDSKAAVGLGANRAILHSESRGSVEKFRPYGLPSPEWLASITARSGA